MKKIILRIISNLLVFSILSTIITVLPGIVKKCAVGEYPKSEIDRYQAA